MRVLVVGSGGREHALAWAISASPLVDALYCAPGNAGIAEEADCVPIRATDIAGLVGFCRRERIDFVVVGPEAPLVLGLVDALEAEGIPAFGPNAAAAALEGSKAFAKDLCMRAGIPTAAYQRFCDPAAAKAFIASHGAPIVVKADGLAGGKGVTVAADLDTAYRAVDKALLERRGRNRRRGFPRRRGGELFRAGRRQDRAAASFRAGLQAPRRRRHRAKHRRHGCGFACPLPRSRTRRQDHGAHHPACGRGDGVLRPAVQGRALCRADADPGGSDAARIQRPPRRPRGAGADHAADERPLAGADRRARRRLEIS